LSSDFWRNTRQEKLLDKCGRRDNPYVLDLIRVLLPHRRGLRRPLVLDLLHKSRRDRNLPIPSNFDETVQSVFQQHCADSAVFKKKGANCKAKLCSIGQMGRVRGSGQSTQTAPKCG
jgi:hypothetical protein